MSKLPFPERVLHQHIAVLGKTGSGKSSALRDIAEFLLDHKKRVAIIDPKGDWWGLKSSADGKSAGYPVITFGGFKEPRATDVPINPQSGKHVAELIASGNRPCVLGFRGWMPGELRQFWLDFAPTLFNANEGELFVIIDEVHNFAPKGKILDPDSGKCLHWTNRIMSEGRGLGLTFFIASQRPQKVHNDTLDGCETLVAMRVVHPAARQAMKDWIDGNGDKEKGTLVLNTLAQLKRGEAWIWSPDNDFGPMRVQFPMFQTFDSFAPPQLQKKVSQAGWSEVDLDQVKQKLAAVIAEVKSNDPKELKAEIARLKQELAKKIRPTAAPPAKIERDEKREQRIAEQAAKAARVPLLKRLQDFQRAAKPALHAIAALQTLADADLPAEEVAAIAPVSAARSITGSSTPRQRTEPISIDGITPAQTKIIHAAAQFHAVGIPWISKKWLAARSGASHKSSSYGNNLGALRSRGLIDYKNGNVFLTEAGLDLSGSHDEPLTQEQMAESCRGLLTPAQKAVFDALYQVYPASLSREDLAAAAQASPTSSSYGNNLGALRSAGMIDYGADKSVHMQKWIFLEGAA